MDNPVISPSPRTTAPYLMTMGSVLFHIPGQEPMLPQPPPAPAPEAPAPVATEATPVVEAPAPVPAEEYQENIV
jgi:hypothetical protein